MIESDGSQRLAPANQPDTCESMKANWILANAAFDWALKSPSTRAARSLFV